MSQLKLQILMLGPDPSAMGGMATVAAAYRRGGLFERCNVRYLATYVDRAPVIRAWVGFKALVAFLLALAAGSVRLVHVHVAERTSFMRKSLFILAALMARVPVLFQLHGAEFDRFYHNECSAWRQRYVRWILSRSACVCVLSKSWEQWMAEVCPRIRVIRLNNPASIDVDDEDTPTPLGTTIVFLGRLGVRKGTYDLLSAVAQLKSRIPEIRLVCGGDGEHDSVLARARELGIAQNVELAGWVRGEEKTRLLKSAVAFVLPSYNEVLPMAILEAMALGVPVISTRVGGIPDAIADGVEGFLVEPGAVSDLADRIARVVADPSLRASMSRAGKARVKAEFTVDAVVDSLVKIYRGLGVDCA
jgi:glycosyltransferase involved in cell wall biosynthesis